MGPYFGPFFLEGWKNKSVEEGRLLYCVEMCGSISAIDNLYVTKSVAGKLINKSQE